MNNKEISEAQELIDSVRNGTGELAPAKAAFPSDEKGLESGRIVPLRREGDGSVYAFRCTVCNAAWKVYQNKTCSCS